MRIATSQLYAMSINTVDSQEAALTQAQQEVSTQRRVNTAADDPLGAAQAVQLSATSSQLSQYESNQNSVQSSLGLEDSTLGNVNSTLQSISTLLQEAGNQSLSDTDRQAIAQQLQGARDQLLTLANTSDGAGNYIFSGFQGGTPPFTNQAGGGVAYNGDSGVRSITVAEGRQVQSNDPGNSVFLSVQPGVSPPVPAGSAANTGTGTIGAVSITQAGATSNNDQYAITFGGTADAPTYTVTDTSTTPPTDVSTDQPYTADAAIDLGGGMSVAISGAPAAGDTFTVTPAQSGNTDVFSTIDTAIAALKQPASNNPAAGATLTNALATASSELGNTMTNVTTLQASVGGREQEVQALKTVNSNQGLQVSNDLSTIVSADMPQAISQFEMIQSALNASMESFAQVQKLSLFQYID